MSMLKRSAAPPPHLAGHQQQTYKMPQVGLVIQICEVPRTPIVTDDKKPPEIFCVTDFKDQGRCMPIIGLCMLYTAYKFVLDI